jgi:hypothetical protein
MRRGATVAGATLAAVAAWAVATHVAGVDLAVGRGHGRTVIGPGAVVAASLIAGLAAWALLAVLERTVRLRAGRVWTLLALVVLVGSLLGPLGAVDIASGVALAAMHVTVGIILLVGLGSTAPRA